MMIIYISYIAMIIIIIIIIIIHSIFIDNDQQDYIHFNIAF